MVTMVIFHGNMSICIDLIFHGCHGILAVEFICSSYNDLILSNTMVVELSKTCL
jgi:hypothetical protein